MLEVKNIDLSFGGIHAIRNVSFAAAQGEITAIIGPNGAGKTSLFNVISGFYRPQAGSVLCAGHDITSLASHRRVGRGIARTFQNIALYEGMNVLDNIKLGAHHRLRTGLFAGLVYCGPARREEAALRDDIEAELLDLLELRDVANAPISALPFGVQRRVEIARALASRPKILLLDEPMAGLTREETAEMVRLVLDIKARWGTTILLVEHDMGVVMDISDKIVVVNFGEKIAEGPAEAIQIDQAVIEAYLGAGESGRAV